MKINIAYPDTGCQKVIEIEDERTLRALYDKRMSHEVEGEVLGEGFKGYIFRISGGNDKQGFPMKQGVLTNQRVRLLLSDGHSCYRIRRKGERKRKSVRGCIVSGDLSVVNLVVVKKGDQEVPGLTDAFKPKRLGPKRATRLRRLFNLSKEDDVRKVVIRRQIVKDGKKPVTKAPKIQRLITPQRLQRKRHLRAVKRERWERSVAIAKEYNEKMAKFYKDAAEKDRLQKKRSMSRKESAKPTTTPAPAAAAPVVAKPSAPAAKPVAAKPAAKAAAAKPAAKPAAAAPAKSAGKPSGKAGGKK